MAGDSAYLLIAPSCLRNGRFAPILTRVLSRAVSEVVAVQSIAFTPADAQTEAPWIGGPAPEGIAAGEWNHWVARSLAGLGGRFPGVLLVFRGPEAAGESTRLLGGFRGATVDDSLRGTFGDLEPGDGGTIRFCEPVGFAAGAGDGAGNLRRLVAKIRGNPPTATPGMPGHERTLVLVKPDNFRHGGGRPGQVADLFCRSGLALVGARLLRFSPRQALEFYGPVREVLRTRLDGVAGGIAANELARGGLGIEFDESLAAALGRVLGPVYGEQRFRNLVMFMTGRMPAADGLPESDEPGTETTLALVFEGPDAVARMRTVLGPTDPTKAPPGTVRREFGRSLLDNAGHASDSADSAAREIAIVRPWDCDSGSWC